MLFPRKAGSYDSDEAHIVAAVLPLCFTAAAAAVTMSAMRQQDIDDISALIASALQVLDKMHAIHNLIPRKAMITARVTVEIGLGEQVHLKQHTLEPCSRRCPS